MLNKLANHLKDVLFFKSVIYVLLIIGLLLLVPNFEEELEDNAHRLAIANFSLETTKFQLKSVDDFENNIGAIKEEYDQLVSTNLNSNCQQRSLLIRNIQQLATTYNLFEPIDIYVVRSDVPNIVGASGRIKLAHYEAHIEFQASDFANSLAIIADIKKILPAGANILAVQLLDQPILTPDLIEHMRPTAKPMLVKNKLKILLKELIYEQ